VAGPENKIPQLLARQLQEQTMLAVLAAQPNNYTDAIYRPASGISRRYVGEAVDMIEGEQCAFWTVGELASQLGISLRTLELGFRQELEQSPTAYIRGVRLQRAHEELLRADPATVTVGKVALKWGFAHFGRFSASYSEAFGRRPSDTLRSMP
jgi:transcriptional regulator GlxA family with amidase domain